MKWKKLFKDYPETWKSGAELINDELIKDIDDMFPIQTIILKVQQHYFDVGRKYERKLRG